MPTVFFSWQADTCTTVGRNLVERSLERAVAAIGSDTSVEEAVREMAVDKDTKGVPGSPPIVDTIFRKIDASAVFVPDLTFVGTRADGRPTPNPNVLIEYGWALKALGHHRIVPIMNVAFGKPSDASMPFDMRHLRNPLQYECLADADPATRQQARDTLAKLLESALRAVLSSDEFRATLPQAPAPEPFAAAEPKDGVGKFRCKGEPLGVADDVFPGTSSYDIRLRDGPATWLRLMPRAATGRSWSSAQLRDAASGNDFLLMPIGSGEGSYGYVRAADGFGVRAMLRDDNSETMWIAFAFDTGEVWTVDTYAVAAHAQFGSGAISLDEKNLAMQMGQYSKFLARLGVDPPYRWICGMEGVKGRGMHVPVQPGHSGHPFARGHCVVDNIVVEGSLDVGQSPAAALRPFFNKVYDQCGLSRPAWLDG